MKNFKQLHNEVLTVAEGIGIKVKKLYISQCGTLMSFYHDDLGEIIVHIYANDDFLLSRFDIDIDDKFKQHEGIYVDSVSIFGFQEGLTFAKDAIETGEIYA